MPAALGICGTIYKVKKEENLFWGEIWLPPQNARTRVRLLYIFIILRYICNISERLLFGQSYFKFIHKEHSKVGRLVGWF